MNRRAILFLCLVLLSSPKISSSEASNYVLLNKVELDQIEQRIAQIELQNRRISKDDDNMDRRIKQLEVEVETLKKVQKEETALCAFSATRTTSAKGEKFYLAFDKVTLEVGEKGYDGETGMFTAPVDGVYLITTHLDAVEKVQSEAVIKKNGENIAKTVKFNGKTGGTFGTTIITELKRGDEVGVFMLMGELFGYKDGNLIFSGALLR